MSNDTLLSIPPVGWDELKPCDGSGKLGIEPWKIRPCPGCKACSPAGCKPGHPLCMRPGCQRCETAPRLDDSKELP